MRIREREHHFAGSDRTNPSTAHALPKYVIGTGLVNGFDPG